MSTLPAIGAASVGTVLKTATQAVGAPAAVSDELKAAAKQFEAIFVRQMIGSMRQAKLADDILGSDASDQFRDMSDSKTADSLAEKGSFGIADMLIRQLAARVGTKNSATPPMGTTVPAMASATTATEGSSQ